MTIHEVLWTSERKRQALGSSTVGVAALQLPSADSWSSERIDRCRTILSSGAGALQELGQVTKDSPWIGYAPNLLIKGDELPILQTIESALTAARMVHARVQEIAQAFDCSPWSLSEMEEAVKVTDLLGKLIEPVDEELLTRMFSGGLTSIDRVKREAKRLAEALEKVRGLQGEVATTLNRPEAVRIGELEKVSALAVKSLSPKALSLSREQLRPALESLEQQLSLVGQLTGERSTLVPSPGDELKRKLHTYSQDDSLRRLEDESAKNLMARAGEALPVLRNTQASILELSLLLSAAKIPFSGKADEIGQLVSGKGLAELQPDARASTTDADALRDFVSRGWADWTAAQFIDTSGHISEILEVTGDALEQLRSFMGRLGLPLDTSKASLEALEVVLAIAEGAPKELLGSRGPGYERADFADIAIRAEEEQKNLAYRSAKVEHAFHVDTLPDIGALKSYVAVFRRGDGLLNFLKKDWRQATAAFKACSKSTSRPNASGMAERFAAVLAWRTSTEQYESDAQLKSILGSLFLGTRTDFDKVRRLHKWVRESHEALMPTQLATAVNVASWAEGNFALLATNAGRVRGWLSKIYQLSRFVNELPGFDPALRRVRRAEELINPLTVYAETLNQGAKSLKAVARPTASVQRALELIELTKQLDSQKDALLSLVSAPSELAKVGGSLGLSESELVYQDIAAALPTLTNRAKQISELGETLSAGLGAEYSLRTGLPALEGILLACELANDLLFTGGTARQRMLNELLAQRTKQLSDGLSVSSFVEDVGLNSASVEKVLSGAHAYVESQNRLKVVAEDPSFLGLFEPVLDGVKTAETSIALCIARAQAVSQLALHLPRDAGNRLLSVGSAGTARALQEAVAGYVTSFSAYKAAMEGLEKWGKLDWVSWRGYPSSSDAVAKLERAHAGGGSLVSWSKFLAAKEEAGSQGVGEILLRAEGGDLTPSEIVPAFEYVFFRSLSRGILTRHKELARFTGSGHEQLRSNFAQLDKELIALNGALYAAKVDAAKRPIPGVSSGRASDLTEMSLLTKETKKQKRHIPIRQLMQRAGRSLQELKPCFMMGPLSVAQYLEQGKLTFDLIVMDEASQLRPEDALGAIARGRQLVVVGDPKQLPPTNFFDRLMEDDEDDAEDASSVVEGVESILGICEHLYRPVRTLRWHYRSKHESLIAFSNSQFYDHRLVVFPSPYRRNRKLGVNYRYVKEGLYKDRRNFPEAQRVVDAVLEHIVASPEESLGVVTLNQTQRQLIEDILDAKVRDIKAVSDYFERHERAGWPFFVKNLENVQGDERDVIFVSTTFGRPGPGEAIRQNFGPINRADGWRRLNVLFTRARRRIDLFTSLQPNDIRLDEKASLGKKALQDYLTFASTGRLPGAPGASSEREADSEFEIAVADALRRRGYDTEPQVGVAGYFLDLGVRHPDRRGEYLAGIECDGVTYHSSLSARDRDRIRQEVLESLGWHGRIIRVWSTDWFSDPDAQTDRLVAFLEQRRKQDESSPSPYSDDDLESAEAFIANEEVGEKLNGTVEDGTGNKGEPDVAIELSLFVEVGDRVTYETLQPAERHTVTIVDSPSNLKLGLLNDQTPLAEALLGLCAGDKAELRVKDHPLRGIQVLRVERPTNNGWVSEGAPD